MSAEDICNLTLSEGSSVADQLALAIGTQTVLKRGTTLTLKQIYSPPDCDFTPSV